MSARLEFSNWSETLGPAWAGDFFDPNHLMRGGALLEAAEFTRTDSVEVVAAAAIADAETIDVDALSGPIPSGTILYFGADKYARLTAAAAAGAVELAVEPLTTALDADDTATYEGVGLTHVPSGTIIGRTYAERAVGTGFGPVDFTAATSVDDEEVYILAWDVANALINPECELYRHGGLVKENFLPGWEDLDPILQAWVRENYHAILGQE